MVRWRYAAVFVMLAGTLAGCTPLRGQKTGAIVAGEAREPAGKVPATTTASVKSAPVPPDYAPALFIPGPADPSPKPQPPQRLAQEVETLPLKLTAAEIPTELPPLVAANQEHPLRTLHRRAKLKFDSLSCYEMRMRRREVVAGKPKPEELIEARFRREPFSVYFRWVGAEAKGREVVFVQGQQGNLIHTLTAKDDVFLIPAGTRFKIAPDSPMVKSKSRYPITEAGLGSLIDRFGKLAEAVERGDHRLGTAKCLGAFKRKEFEDKVEGVVQAIPPGVEPLLPGGGQRLWCFDLDHGLPVLVVTHDEQDREVECYCHERLQFPTHLDDDAFNPDKLWKR
jgi:hypothetical protein